MAACRERERERRGAQQPRKVKRKKEEEEEEGYVKRPDVEAAASRRADGVDDDAEQ